MLQSRTSRRLFFRCAAPLLAALLAPSLPAQCEYQEILALDAMDGDRFGHAVAASGSRAVVGAPGTDGRGAVHVFRRTNNGWILEQEIRAFDGSLGDEFGCAVDMVNKRLLVGARKHGLRGAHAGAAYVYAWDGRRWTLESQLFAPDGARSDQFGHAVALAGNKAFVSARLDDDRGRNSGSVHLFRNRNGTWTHRQKLLAGDGEAGAQFGHSLDAESDLLVVGARHHQQVGAAYVLRSIQGRFEVQAMLQSAAPEAGMEFGFDVALAQGLVAVGAPRPTTAHPSGVVSLHRFDGATWDHEDVIRPDDLPDGSRFGHSVSLLGNRLAVGAVNQDRNGQGVVHAWFHQNGLWMEEARLVAADSHAGEHFGASVSLSADMLVAGAPLHDHMGTIGGRADAWLFQDAVAWWQNYGSGWAGTRGIPTLVPQQLPVLGSQLPLVIGNSLGSPTQAAVLAGFASDSRATALGGTYLVDWVRLIPFTFSSANDETFLLDIPCATALAGTTFYLQALVDDPGASHGVAFSEGLALGFGQ